MIFRRASHFVNQSIIPHTFCDSLLLVAALDAGIVAVDAGLRLSSIPVYGTSMILVTGAGGKTGRAVVGALVTRGASVRALLRTADQAGQLEALGADQTVVGDLQSGEDLRSAARGVTAVYHICPNLHPDEFEIGKRILGVLQAEAVPRIVYHSVLRPQTEQMPHHWQKLRVEEELFESGLDYTILQPAAYMQNILASRMSIIEKGVYRIPYAVETRLGLVDLQDVAEAAAIVLTASGHTGATYELSGARTYDQAEIARELSLAVGKEVRTESIDRRDWAEAAGRGDLSDYAVSTLLQMFRYYERYGFYGNPRVLSMLLGRPPRSLAEFLASLGGWDSPAEV